MEKNKLPIKTMYSKDFKEFQLSFCWKIIKESKVIVAIVAIVVVGCDDGGGVGSVLWCDFYMNLINS